MSNLPPLNKDVMAKKIGNQAVRNTRPIISTLNALALIASIAGASYCAAQAVLLGLEPESAENIEQIRTFVSFSGLWFVSYLPIHFATPDNAFKRWLRKLK